MIPKLADDIIILPSRRFTTRETWDLRTAHTHSEILEAEEAIRNISSFEDIVKHIGNGAQYLFLVEEAKDFAYKITEVENQDDHLATLKTIKDDAFIRGTPPRPFLVSLDKKILAAQSRRNFLLDHIVEKLPELRPLIRRAHLILRKEDYNFVQYGEVCTNWISDAQRADRRGKTCEWCGEKGHLKYDHRKYRCTACKKFAPNHSLVVCGSHKASGLKLSKKQQRERRRLSGWGGGTGHDWNGNPLDEHPTWTDGGESWWTPEGDHNLDT